MTFQLEEAGDRCEGNFVVGQPQLVRERRGS